MNIASLSNQELVTSLDSLVERERENTVELLRHLIELDSRGLYRELGYSSLFDYCMRRLKLSEGSTFRRMKAARCLSDNPELEGLLRSGKVTLCAIAAAANSIEKKVTAIEEIVGCSKREVESIVAKSNPLPIKPREVIKPLVVEVPAEEPKREERVRLEFSVTKETFEVFKALQEKLSVEAGKELSVEAVFEKLLTGSPQRKARRCRVVRSSVTRYVPKAVKQEVYARDKGQCCFVSADGVRCTERRYLQFDHVRPYAKGGATEVSNLRLLCPGHNRLMAEREFGVEFIKARATSATGGGA